MEDYNFVLRSECCSESHILLDVYSVDSIQYLDLTKVMRTSEREK